MNAYDTIRLDDLRERSQKGESLSKSEQALLERLERQGRREWETEKPVAWFGGHPDMF